MADSTNGERREYTFTLHVGVTPAYVAKLLQLADKLGHSDDVVVTPALTGLEAGSEAAARPFQISYASPQVLRKLHDQLAGILPHPDPGVLAEDTTSDITISSTPAVDAT